MHKHTAWPLACAAKAAIANGARGLITARRAAVRGGQYCLDAHWLRRADQVAMRAEVDRICMLCL